MGKFCWQYDGGCGSRFLSRHATRLIAASAIVVTGCVADRPTSVSPDDDDAQAARAPSADQATTSSGTIANFRLLTRTGSVLRLNWDWPTGGGPTHHYVLSYAGRTVTLNQYYPGTILDVGHLNLTPGHSYTFTLRAIDTGGNASSPARLSFETTPPQPPSNLRQVSTKRIPHPPGPDLVYPDTTSYSPAQDNAGPIRSYELIVDGVSFGTIPGTGGRFSLIGVIAEAYRTLPCGPTTVQLRAHDSSLNASQLSAPLAVVFPDYPNCPPPHGP